MIPISSAVCSSFSQPLGRLGSSPLHRNVLSLKKYTNPLRGLCNMVVSDARFDYFSARPRIFGRLDHNRNAAMDRPRFSESLFTLTFLCHK